MTDRTILFADVCDSTRIMEAVGDVEGREHMASVLGIMAKATSDFGGRVVKTIGDEVMSSFAAPEQALAAAAQMHRLVSGRPSITGIHWALRIGVNHGPVVEEAGDVFGDVVNVAARLTQLSAPNQILTTRASSAGATAADLAFRNLGPHEVRGRTEVLELVEVLWDSSGTSVTIMAPRGQTSVSVELTLQAGDSLIRFGPTRQEAITIGRGAECTLPIAGTVISRTHAKVFRRGQMFVLQDQSTNGTFVRPEGLREVQVHRDQFVLQGRGVFRLGEKNDAPGAGGQVEFHIAELD